MMPAASILLVDDDHHLATSLGEWLAEEGFETHLAGTLEDARQQLKQHAFELVITDLRLGGEDGMTLVSDVKKHHSDTPVLVMTGYATPNTAVEAVPRRGSGSADQTGHRRRIVARHRSSDEPTQDRSRKRNSASTT